MDIELIIGIFFSLMRTFFGSSFFIFETNVNKNCLHLISLIIEEIILRTIVKSNRKFSVLNVRILFNGEQKFNYDNTFLCATQVDTIVQNKKSDKS